MIKYFTMVSDSSGTESGILLALIQHVHVLLAHVDRVLIVLKAAQE